MELVRGLPRGPTMHTGPHTRSHTRFTPFCAHVSTMATCPRRTEHSPVFVGGQPRDLTGWAGAPAHLTLTSVRKYVSTPHQRRGVVVVVNEKALV